ncbi:MAG: heme biosynthesis protein HemY [Alphaproteobacteria bacterium]|nr:heme biosynthesis protein HemY [Alphaproteobacteria bacterium]
MRRALAFLVAAALLMLAAVWFADRPGSVSIVWQGHRVDMSVGMLLAAILAVAVGAVALHGLWRLVVHGPRRLARWRHERRRRSGYVALTQGMVAVAAGDPREARRHARRADVLLDEPPLTMLLAAQAAQLVGDESEAKRQFRKMLERPETEFLGLRGLITQALKTGAHDEALRLARRARTLRPQTAWVQTTLFELESRSGDWRAAQETLRQASRLAALPPATARRHEAAVALERVRQAAAEQRGADALAEAEHAWKADPDHPAVAAALAERYIVAGKSRAAARILEQAWSRQPQVDLVDLYLRAKGAQAPLQRVKAIEHLAGLAPRHVDSSLALARANLEAKLWGEARRHVQRAIELAGGTATVRMARLMARIEDEEKGDQLAARVWLGRAAEAPADPAWTCGACGAVHARWQAICGHCGAFDRIEWSAGHRVATPPPVIESPNSTPPGVPAVIPPVTSDPPRAS